MNLLFGHSFIVRHREDIIGAGLPDTSPSDFTVDSVWRDMYKKDRYSRDRVMKSARLLLPYLKDNDTILDVGCFTWEARKYYSRSISYIGIDTQKYHPKTILLDLNNKEALESLPKCNQALCLETLEHLVQPSIVLSSISKVLADGGYLVVSLPNEATLFHRIRGLLGTLDAECFQDEGKHLHLPSLKQTRKFVSSFFDIVDTKYYIAPSGCGSRQKWVGVILSLLPDAFHQFLADRWPSLFARGFIFLLKKRISNTPDQNVLEKS